MIVSSAKVWPWVPVALLTAMLGGLGVMASLAVDDAGFALERNYYAKAVAYDAEIAQRAQNARLGWSLAASAEPVRHGRTSKLELELRDAAGVLGGAKVHVEALRNASAGRVLDAELSEAAPGHYRTELPFERGGLWELRFTATRGAERFTKSERLEIAEAAP
ncbi:MAG: FixH family protein [Myxococcota bacterium]|nr:FixH family protein [Myxococcota bacterium]